MAKSESVGASIGDVEITSISKHGFWLYLGDRELFVHFRKFPWSRAADAPVKQVLNVRWPSPDHLV